MDKYRCWGNIDCLYHVLFASKEDLAFVEERTPCPVRIHILLLFLVNYFGGLFIRDQDSARTILAEASSLKAFDFVYVAIGALSEERLPLEHAPRDRHLLLHSRWH